MFMSLHEFVSKIDKSQRTECLKVDDETGSMCGGDFEMYFMGDQVVIWMYREEAHYRLLFTDTYLYHDFYPKNKFDQIIRFDMKWISTEEELFQESLVDEVGEITLEDISVLKELYHNTALIVDHYYKHGDDEPYVK